MDAMTTTTYHNPLMMRIGFSVLHLPFRRARLAVAPSPTTLTGAMSHRHIRTANLVADIAAYRAGDDQAGNRLARILHAPLLLEAARFLGDDGADVEDVVQDALLSTLRYLRRHDGTIGDLVKLAATIARNRCRDLLRWRRGKTHVDIVPMSEWLADVSVSPLDDLERSERIRLLGQALETVSKACRRLLRAFYLEKRTAEEIRREIGLGTVQGVYFRRTECLRQARRAFDELLHDTQPPIRRGVS